MKSFNKRSYLLLIVAILFPVWALYVNSQCTTSMMCGVGEIMLAMIVSPILILTWIIYVFKLKKGNGLISKFDNRIYKLVLIAIAAAPVLYFVFLLSGNLYLNYGEYSTVQKAEYSLYLPDNISYETEYYDTYEIDSGSMVKVVFDDYGTELFLKTSESILPTKCPQPDYSKIYYAKTCTTFGQTREGNVIYTSPSSISTHYSTKIENTLVVLKTRRGEQDDSRKTEIEEFFDSLRKLSPEEFHKEVKTRHMKYFFK